MALRDQRKNNNCPNAKENWERSCVKVIYWVMRVQLKYHFIWPDGKVLAYFEQKTNTKNRSQYYQFTHCTQNGKKESIFFYISYSRFEALPDFAHLELVGNVLYWYCYFWNSKPVSTSLVGLIGWRVASRRLARRGPIYGPIRKKSRGSGKNLEGKLLFGFPPHLGFTCT